MLSLKKLIDLRFDAKLDAKYVRDFFLENWRKPEPRLESKPQSPKPEPQLESRLRPKYLTFLSIQLKKQEKEKSILKKAQEQEEGPRLRFEKIIYPIVYWGAEELSKVYSENHGAKVPERVELLVKRATQGRINLIKENSINDEKLDSILRGNNLVDKLALNAATSIGIKRYKMGRKFSELHLGELDEISEKIKEGKKLIDLAVEHSLKKWAIYYISKKTKERLRKQVYSVINPILEENNIYEIKTLTKVINEIYRKSYEEIKLKEKRRIYAKYKQGMPIEEIIEIHKLKYKNIIYKIAKELRSK